MPVRNVRPGGYIAHPQGGLSFLSIGAALLLSCGTGSVDRPSWVHDLRILAIRAEPPEVMIDPLAPALPPAIQLEALVIDPAGAGRPLTWNWRACVEGEANLGNARTGEESGCPTDASLELNATGETATFSPSLDYLLAAQRKDSFRGFGGMRILIQLDVTAGEETVRTVKRLIYNAPIVAGMAANVNPQLLGDGLLLDGQPWAAATVPCMARDRPYLIKPVPAPASIEDYVVPTFELTPRALKEAWRYWWFTTAGRLNGQTGGAMLGTADENNATEWRATSRDPEGPATFWMVVRDGRGGVAWVRRNATIAATCAPVL